MWFGAVECVMVVVSGSDVRRVMVFLSLFLS